MSGQVGQVWCLSDQVKRKCLFPVPQGCLVKGEGEGARDVEKQEEVMLVIYYVIQMVLTLGSIVFLLVWRRHHFMPQMSVVSLSVPK